MFKLKNHVTLPWQCYIYQIYVKIRKLNSDNVQSLSPNHRNMSDRIDLSCLDFLLEKPKLALPHNIGIRTTPRVELKLTPSRIVNGREFYCADAAGYADHEISKDGYFRTKEGGYTTRGSLKETERYRLHVRSTVDGKKKSPYVYQIMGIVFLGPPPTPKHTIDHLDRKPWNDVISNLAWATKSEQSMNQYKPKFFKKSKPVTAVSIETGQEIASFATIRQFFECTRMNTANVPYSKNNAAYIRAACKNGWRQFGYWWKYCMESLPGEEWRNLRIKDFIIQVSNKGRIINTKGAMTSGNLDDRGYKMASLMNKHYSIHRLVMAAFFGPDETRVVNHKDGDKTNNKLENLEYLTVLENNNHAIATGLRKAQFNGHKSKKVQQLDLNTGRVIAEFVSGAEAGRAVGIHGNAITGVCNGVCDTSCGFGWRWA